MSGQYPNQGAYQEVVVQTRALPAEVGAGGVSVNMITKDGGNTLRGELFTHLHRQRRCRATTSAPSRRARGLVAPSATDVFYDVNAGVGGPIVRDKLWFFASGRRFRVDRFEASTFNPDGSQSLDENLIWNATGKLTWQINPANRLSSFVDYNYKLRNHRRADDDARISSSRPKASYYSPLSGPGGEREADVDAAAEPAARCRLLVVLRAVVARLPAGPAGRTRCRAWTSRGRR